MRIATMIAAVLLSLGCIGSAAAQESRWVGAYVCGQGVQGLTLAITRLPGDELRAVFEFYPNPTNPGVGAGSFEMSGRTDGRSINLVAQRWIDAPPSYNMVDFIGEVSANNESLTGAIYAQGVLVDGCTAAALVRAP